LDGRLVAIRIFKGIPGEPRPLLRAGVRLCLMTMRILIVEDEEHLAQLLAEVLDREGYSASVVSDGRSGLTRALSEDFDLLVLDWMLPDLDRIQVVKRLRAADVRVPILMLTARAQVEDRVEVLDAGADDYLPKPFAFPELLARVRALSRRPPENESEGTVLTAGDVALDPIRHEVQRAGERVDLTAKEFALLATLMQRPGQVFTRSVLLDTVWGGTTGAYTNVVDLYIHYLRKKLDAGEEPSRIRTVHGTGYTFDPRPEYPSQRSSQGQESIEET
jgi:DNA-binding response OmpR family regulator